jgi:hypothetical protein
VTAWVLGATKLPAFDDDVWELYDGSTDWSQAKDLSSEMPEKLHELQRLWLIEATKYNVLPLDDRGAERFDADAAGRPQLVRGTSQMLFGGMGRLSEHSVLNIKNRSFSITAEIEVPEGGAEGPIVAQGGHFGGWGLYVKGGRAAFVQRARPTAVRDRGRAAHSCRHTPAADGVRCDGGGLAKGGDVTLYYDGEKAGEGRVEATHPLIFSADETTDVAYETGTPVSAEHTRQRFSGAVNWVKLDLGPDAHDHLVETEDAMRVAMSVQ